MKTRDPQSFNRYSYVNNDRVNFVDRTGLSIAAPGNVTIGSGFCWFVIVAYFETVDKYLVGGGCIGGNTGPGDVDTGGGGTEVEPDGYTADENRIARLAIGQAIEALSSHAA